MIRHSLNFILGTAATAGTASALNGINPGNFGNLDELIKYIISILGGIMATVILNILKKKFPYWFKNQKNNSF